MTQADAEVKMRKVWPPLGVGISKIFISDLHTSYTLTHEFGVVKHMTHANDTRRLPGIQLSFPVQAESMTYKYIIQQKISDIISHLHCPGRMLLKQLSVAYDVHPVLGARECNQRSVCHRRESCTIVLVGPHKGQDNDPVLFACSNQVRDRRLWG